VPLRELVELLDDREDEELLEEREELLDDREDEELLEEREELLELPRNELPPPGRADASSPSRRTSATASAMEKPGRFLMRPPRRGAR
jgi:hypothetical protein